MRWIFPVLVVLLASATSLRAVDPIPEFQQGPLAMRILDAYHGTLSARSSKKLHIIYFTPSDRDPEARYRERLDAILEDIRAFYRDGMDRAGLGAKTFDLDRDADGKLIIHLVKGEETDAAYRRSGHQQNQSSDVSSRERIEKDCRSALKAAGISSENETVLIFCNLARWDEKTRRFSHHSPYAGSGDSTGGLCFAVDSVILNADDLSRKEPQLNDAEWGDESLGKFNTIFIGGIAHELGHAFSLPHCGERRDEKSRGVSLMGIGNHMYRDERRNEGPGAFLTMASAMKLAGLPLFSKTDQDFGRKPKLKKCVFQLSTNLTRSDLVGRRGALRVDGTVNATPPVYGVIAYFDSLKDGGYRTPAATAVPDEQGRFAIEISDLAATSKGELRLEFCHANGVVTKRRAPFRIKAVGILDLTQSDLTRVLEPVTAAVLDENPEAARIALDQIELSDASDLAKNIATKLTATLNREAKPSPASAPLEITTLPLGDAGARTSAVGWLKPKGNRIPLNDEISSPLLDSGEIYATGLFAHAPSRYVFDLGGKWKKLLGKGGLHTVHQPFGSVVFVLKADGKEVFRSSTIWGDNQANYDVDVSGVKLLELIVEDANDSNHNDWALWLDPMLFR